MKYEWDVVDMIFFGLGAMLVGGTIGAALKGNTAPPLAELSVEPPVRWADVQRAYDAGARDRRQGSGPSPQRSSRPKALRDAYVAGYHGVS